MSQATPSEARTAVLLLLSSPLDAPVGIDKARARLQEALREVRGAAHFVTRIAEADAVQGYLGQGNRPRFRVLHYLGHGYKPEDVPFGALVFEDAAGGSRFLDNFHLRAVLNPANRPEPEFQLAVLTACHSESVAMAMHALGVRHIIAVEADDSVYEVAAVAYFRRFYQVLLTGGTVADAHAAGRNAVLLDEQLARIDPTTTRREAAKFKLLPETVDHQQPLAGLVTGDAPVEFEALPTLDPPYFIAPPRTFVGRSADQRAVLQQLAERRALLIQGMSGVGKSALAWETARWLVTRRRVRPQDVVFVSLNNRHTLDDVHAALATALGMQVGEATPDVAARLLANALPAHALLVIDEAETAISGGGLAVRRLLERLVQAPAEPIVLVTSQKDIGGAHFPVYPLARLHPQAALTLFAAVANLTGAEWAALDPAQLLKALEYVDRLPRAVELVAHAWRRNYRLNLAWLIEDLAERFEEVMADPAFPDEVKSVVVGVTLAYDRLRQRSEAAADLFLRLGLFPGGLSEAGVEEIFGRDARRLLPLIEDDSLAERTWPDLLYLPTPLRLFAERRLGDACADERTRWSAATLRFYHRLDNEPDHGHVDRLNADLQRAGDLMAAVISRYSHELPSIEAWLDWAYTHEPCTGERLRAPRLTALLENLYVVTDRLRHSRDRLTRALTAAQRCADRGGEANVQKALGDLALREDDLGEARRCYEAALAIYPQIGDRLGEANVLAALARVELLEGQAERAMILLTRALNFYQSINDRYSIAVALYYFGFDLLRLDRRDDAAPLLLQAAGLFEEIGLPQYAVQLRQMAGDAPTPEQQAARLKAAVAELRQRGDASLLLQALAALLALHMEMENWPGAVDTAQELLTIDAANAKAWAMLADAYARLDNEEAAANAYAHAVAGDDANAMLRRNYANTLIPLGRLDEAAAQLAAG